MHQRQADPIQTLRMTSRERRNLMEGIEATALPASPDQNQRADERLRLEVDNVVVEIDPTDGGGVRLAVVPRNLSRGGFAFVHGRFLYPNTKLAVVLPDLEGEPHRIEGKVVRCRHISGMVHEVCVKFREPIGVERFVAAAVV